jgi:HYR domain-containing protein
MSAQRVIVLALVVLVGTGVAAGSANPMGRSGSADSSPLRVLATANIFGAGYRDAPSPAGGGGGTLPPGWRLPAGSARVVTFPSISGKVTPLSGSAPHNGAKGDGGANGSTDIASWRGISGIRDANNGMFLVGVFLGDGEPALPAPPRLDFTGREHFDVLAPLVGQTFLIGDGVGRRYEVPATASRLYVGFADAYNGSFYQGRPGYYSNNGGRLEVVASGVLDGPGQELDTSPPVLHGARNTTVSAPRGKTRVRARFYVWAVDSVDGTLPVACTPRSGSFFKLGRTKVTCSASDSSSNARQARFWITVRPHK